MINREISYERNMTGSYMKIPEGMNPGLDERLMLRGKLPGTLSVEKTYIDGSGQYWYNISGKQSLDTYCRVKQLRIDLVERLVVSICSEIDILEWNLIDTGCLMLDPELVFITNTNREFIFTLYPGNNTRIETEFQQLMEYLLTKIDHKDAALVRSAYEIYEKTMEDGYSIMDIRDYLMQSKQDECAKTTETRAASLQGKNPEPPGGAGVWNSSWDDETLRRKNGKKCAASRPANVTLRERIAKLTAEKWEEMRNRFGFAAKADSPKTPRVGRFFERETVKRQEESPVVYPEEKVRVPQEESFPTVCLSSYRSVPRGILLYQGAEQLEDISLEGRLVRIGHGKDADARIERETISQLHARIDHDGDSYYIEDLNSTNGTSVNDEPLVYKERRQLKINDIVQFADVSYRFC